MSQDISNIIQSWEFDPEKSYRKVVGDDGREKIQVRVDNSAFQGVLQMELDGRPDGKTPYGFEFAFDYYRQALQRYRNSRSTVEGFTLDHRSCEELFDESMRTYNRYIFLLQLQDYHRVLRDTERNMELFRFVHQYAETGADRMNLERWWPYILRINGTARAMLAIQESHDFGEALRIVQQTVKQIEELEPLDFEEFHAERERSRKALEDLKKSLTLHKPLSKREKLKKALARAVTEERFEDAARLRDMIQTLEE
jgi:hypothetical protein